MIGGFGLAGTLKLNIVHASTDVTGIIYSDTTWTKVKSPYVFTGPVGISTGVTLTIETGVTVKLGSLQVNGTLRAHGSSTDPINIDGEGGLIIFAQSSSDWDEQTGSGSIGWIGVILAFAARTIAK